MILRAIDIWMRPIQKDDTFYILKWRNNDGVKKNFINQEELTAEIHEEWLKNKINTGKAIQFIIFTIEENKPIGSIYLRDIDVDKNQAELGIFIGEENNRGKGIGGQAIELIKKYAFDKLKLEKIYLRVLKDNTRAIACYKKNGFINQQELEFEESSAQNILFMSTTFSERKE